MGTASCMCVRPDLSTRVEGARRARRTPPPARRERAGSRATLVERGHAHRRRERVVGRLRHVDVVVGVDDRVVAALPAAHALRGQDLDGPVGEHLVGVHVVADTRHRPGTDPPGSCRSASAAAATSTVSESGRTPRISSAAWMIASAICSGSRPVWRLARAAAFLTCTAARTSATSGSRPLIGKLLDRALGLDAVVGVGRNLERPERVLLGARRRLPWRGHGRSVRLGHGRLVIARGPAPQVPGGPAL